MKETAGRRGWLVAGLAGTFVFGWFGFFEALSLLFFQGALLQVVGMADKLRMFSNIDTGLFLFAALVYGALGFALGLLWWGALSTARERIHTLLGKTPKKEPKDFYELFVRQALSLAFLIALAALAYLDWLQLAGRSPALSYPMRVIRFVFHMSVAAALSYGFFRLFFWVLNKIPSLPLLGFLRRPLFHGICGGATLLFLCALAIAPHLFRGKPERSRAAATLYKPARMPNIVFVVLDTCRADHFSGYGYPKPTTPHIDAFMNDAVRFTHAVTPSPWTLPSHASMFTGLYPRSHGASSKHFSLDSGFLTVAEVLQASGYATVGFSANPMVGSVTNLDQGFDAFDEVWRNEGREGLLLVKWVSSAMGKVKDKGARKINRHVREWLATRPDTSGPFFMFINFLETHGPYSPPREFRDRFVDKDREGPLPKSVDIYSARFVEYLTGKRDLSGRELSDLRAMYDAELAYLDTRIGELLDILRRYGLFETSLIIMVSDHGENLGEHRMVDHQLCVYDTLLLVPLAIRYPPVFPTPARVDATVQLTSLFPTIMDILGIPQSGLPVSFATGSLLGVVSGRDQGLAVTFSEYDSPAEILKILRFKAPYFDVSVFDRDLLAARDRGFKYIKTTNSTDELYDLASDPGETNNLLGRHPVPEHLGGAIVQFEGRYPLYRPTSAGHPPGGRDKEAIEKLRSLGYIQ
jgi:arylsulfatase A-like enzyme